VSERFLWKSVLLGTALSLAGAASIAARRLTIGSAEGGWSYPYVDSADAGTLRVLALSCLLVGAGVGASWRLLKRFDAGGEHAVPGPIQWALIVAWCLLAILVQGVLRSTSPHSLGAIVASDTATSFYSVAVRTNAGSILSGFERRRQTWPLHAHSNLPGKLLLVRALTRVSTQPEVVGWLIIGLSSVGALLMYFFIRDASGDRFFAGLSAILYLFTPAAFYFVPLLNAVTPVVVLICACLMMRWLNTAGVVYAVALGVAIYGLALFEPTALIAGLLLSVLLIHRIVSGRLPWRTASLHVGAALLAFVATYAAMVGWFGFDLFRAFAAVARDAAEFNMKSGRPYAVWVWQNLFDFAFGVGWCQAVLFFAALADGGTGWTSRWRLTDAPSILLICVSVLAMVGIADAIGVNRGEVTRLWIFLACLAQIPAAYVCRRLGSASAFCLGMMASLIQVALATAMIGFVAP
jgi:hypothetical protein